MSADYSLEYLRDYIHIQHGENFEITPERMEKFWNELAEACEKYDCRRVLAEGIAPKRKMDMMSAYKSGTRASQTSPRLTLACCFPGYKTDEITEFFKIVAENRGVRVEFFVRREDALRWLGVEQTGIENALQSECRIK